MRLRITKCLSDTKVGHFHLVIAGNENVLRLYVSVDDTRAVSIPQSQRNPNCKMKCAIYSKRVSTLIIFFSPDPQ